MVEDTGVPRLTGNLQPAASKVTLKDLLPVKFEPRWREASFSVNVLSGKCVHIKSTYAIPYSMEIILFHSPYVALHGVFADPIFHFSEKK